MVFLFIEKDQDIGTICWYMELYTTFYGILEDDILRVVKETKELGNLHEE